MTASTTSPASSASVAQLRASFPALDRTHRGQTVAYFDAPGGTQVPRPVVSAMEDYLYHHNANTHWPYPTSEETDASIAAARQALAEFLGASPAETWRGLWDGAGGRETQSSLRSSITTPMSRPGARSRASGA